MWGKEKRKLFPFNSFVNMNLQEQINKPLSKKEVIQIAAQLYAKKQDLKNFVLMFSKAQHSDMNHAAWIIGVFAEQYLDDLKEYIPTLVGSLNMNSITDGIKRNVLRVLRQVQLPEETHGIVMNACFDYAANPNEAVAIRSFALEILCRLVVIYPDIKPEVQFIAEDILQQKPSAGLKSRAMKTIKMLR